ncbi:MAG: hypothetical protein KIC54_03375 [Clostridium sp.]|jgi:hypothetical protein|nr:hypothetical protein [Clostridium sp.]
MNRKELKDYKYNQEWIKGRLEYIEEYRSTINKLTTVLSDLPKGSRAVYDNEAEKIAKLQDNVKDLLLYINEEQEKQKLILAQLNKVEQPYKVILEKIYICGKSIVTVASEMNYEYKYMCKQHGIALNKFDELDDKRG